MIYKSAAGKHFTFHFYDSDLIKKVISHFTSQLPIGVWKITLKTIDILSKWLGIEDNSIGLSSIV